MKCKRILSMLLTLCMVLGLLPGTTVTASAAGGATTLYVNGVNMLDESSTAPTGVSYDKSTNTLTLTNAALSKPYNGKDDGSNKLTAIIYSKQGLTINLVGNSTITYSDSPDAKMWMGIMNTYGDLKFTGDGSLTIKNAVETGGTDKLCYGIDAHGTLTVDGPTITIDREKTDILTCQAEYGVLLMGTFAINSGTVTIRTRNTTGNNTALYTINGKNNTLGSGAKLIAEAGNRSNADTNSYGIITESSLQLGAGASLRASGGEKALKIDGDGMIKAASADLTLSATGSETPKAATKDLKEISSDKETLNSLRYKTIEVTASAAGGAGISTWEELKSAFTNGGNVTLTGNVTAQGTDSALTVPSGTTVTLDLNGHTINRNLTSPADDGNAIIVQGTLTVDDTSGGKQGKITGAYSSRSDFDSGAIYVAGGGNFTLNAGSICGNKTSGRESCGTGVSVASNATFTMTGGSICENVGTGVSSLGGGVGAKKDSTVNLLGGRIEKNSTESSGGGLRFYSSTVTVGGSIVIKDNMVQGKTSNVSGVQNAFLLLSENKPLTKEAKIGWSGLPITAGKAVAKGNNAVNYVDNFFSDKDPSYIIGVKADDSNTIYIATANSTVVTKPGAAGGATTLYVNGVNMLDESSTAPNGVSYDKSTNTLTLTNAELSKYHSATTGSPQRPETLNTIIYAEGSLTINLVGNSTITYSGGETGQLKGIYNGTGDLTFTGNGSLKIENAVGTSGSSNTCAGIELADGTLTVNGPTITIDAKENTKPSCILEYGVKVSRGAFVFESGNMTLKTQGSSEDVALYIQNFTETASKLGSGAKLIADANDGCGLYINNKSFIIETGASLRATGQKQALYLQCVDFKSGDGSPLSVAVSETYNAEKSTLQSITFNQDDFSGSEKYKTLEVTEGGSPAQYATAELKLNGYTAGAALNQATITTTSSTGFASISLAGFMDRPDGKSETMGNFSGTKTYYVSLKMPRSAGYELQENGGKPVGVTLEGATPEPLSTNKNFLIFKMNSKPAVAAPTFTDGFGKTDCTFDTYTKGATNNKGYTFAGWFGDDGNELTSAGAAVVGKTYTAKWTKNNKTVRTTALDLTKISESNTFGAVLQGSVYTNADEGWTWDAASKTLTLSGATMDIQLDSGPNIGITLPAGATVATAENTENAVSVRAANPERLMGCAIGSGKGDLTISGKGILQVVGVDAGISTDGNITINAPIDVSITGDETAAIYIESEEKHSITIHDALNILEPAGGVIGFEGKCITTSDGKTPATNVVIGVAKKYTVTYNTNGGSAVDSATVSEGHKLTVPTVPTKDGYTFLGWYKDAAFTNRWNFDADTVTGNTTLYAKWAEQTKTYGISGTVYESNNTTPASGVTVKLMKGDTQVASTTSATDATGAYSFTGIAPGVYNIVTEKDDTTQTTLVIVTNHDETGKNVTLPQSKVNSKLTVKGADTPYVVAGGLDKEAAAVKDDNPGATSVKVEMTVESKHSTEIDPTDKTNIDNVASGKTLEYLDIKVTKTVDTATTTIDQTNNVLEIVVPFQTSGRNNITVYRHHAPAGGTAETKAFTRLDTRPTSPYTDETYYVGDGYVVIYTQKFSTYAIGYNTQSSGGSGSGGSSSSSGSSSSGNSSTISTPSAKNGTVSVSPKSASKGTTVTVTVTPDKGYVLETLTATDASGKKLDLKNLGSGKYSFTMPASKVEVKATFMEDNTMLNYFVDVPASAYYYDAVLWAAEHGITGGTDATHFSPDGVCTRAQAVTFLWRAAGSPAPSATAMPFTDVAADSYYYNAVLWAMENGITVGTSSTTFSPDLKCSRAHIMTFLWRSEKSPAAGSVNPFTDVSAGAYYADAVLWAVKESVTNGTSSVTFSPDADCTRAQIVTFIWRTLAR